MPFARPKKRDPVDEPALFDYAVAALGRRMRTERELRTLMRDRAHPGEPGQRDIDAVIRRLIDLKYLSDERYAEAFTRIRKDGRLLGQRRVRGELNAKGVPKELADTALTAAYADSDEVALARAYCERKRIAQPPEGPDRAKQAARIMGRLLRAGYSATAVGKLLRSWRIDSGEIPEPEDFDPVQPEPLAYGPTELPDD